MAKLKPEVRKKVHDRLKTIPKGTAAVKKNIEALAKELGIVSKDVMRYYRRIVLGKKRVKKNAKNKKEKK